MLELNETIYKTENEIEFDLIISNKSKKFINKNKNLIDK